MARKDKWVKRWEVNGEGMETYTVAIDGDGCWGCSCPRWRFARAPKPDCKHIEELRDRLMNPPKPWVHAWHALGDLEQGPDRRVPEGLSRNARHILSCAEHEYVAHGFLYSASIHPNEEPMRSMADKGYPALSELVEAGLLVRRGCDGYALELPPARRWWLIHEHDLLERWRKDETGSAFYPSSRHGEVYTTYHDLAGWEFCGRCRTWFRGEHDGCREFSFYEVRT